MTREEAKEILSKINIAVSCGATPILSENQIIEATNVAIKALEQTELNPSYNSIKSELKPCEDAISRKRLIILIDEGAELHPYKVVGDSETYSDYNQGWTDAFDWLYANIDCDNLPSVKPQPKTGHWEEMELVGTGVSKFSCSVCKEGDFYNQIDNPFIPTKYCPNCGAKLMESEDGN